MKQVRPTYRSQGGWDPGTCQLPTAFCILLLATLLFATAAPAQQPFQCDDRLFLTTALEENDPVGIFQLTVADGGSPIYNSLTSNTGVRLNAIGYSMDNFIYGIDPETYTVYRVDANGQATALGVPPNLDTSYTYVAGTVSPDGTRMVLSGRSKETGLDKEFVSIRILPPDLVINQTPVIADPAVRLEDIAFDPIFGLIVGFDSKNKQLVSLSWPGGDTNGFGYSVLSSVHRVEALFFDAAGELYGFGSMGSSEKQSIFFHLNRANGEILETGSGPGGYFVDGCSCPYRIDFFRKIEPTETIPCGELTIVYQTINTSATTRSLVQLRDSLPEGFVITEIVKAPLQGEIVSGVGSNLLQIDNMWVLLGADSIVIRVEVGVEPGLYSTQASLNNLQPALGGVIFSDDPATEPVDDPNVLEIVDPERIFAEDQTFLCEQASITLRPAAAGSAYLWNDGSTEPELEIFGPGWYWVEVSGNCGGFRDSILVVEIENQLTLDLGEDRILLPGAHYSLAYTTNATAALEHAWAASDPAALSCEACPLAVAGPLTGDLSVGLVITDAFGCSAADSIRLTLDRTRRVYFPNAFSPNGDGFNDEFFLQGEGQARILQFLIFDRWGNLVFEARDIALDDPGAGWNGYTGGGRAPVGVYLWVAELEFPDQVRKTYSGDVLLAAR